MSVSNRRGTCCHPLEPLYIYNIYYIYESDIDFEKLRLHLQMLHNAIKAVLLHGIHIQKVTKVQTIGDIFNEQSSLKVMLSEIHKLLLIFPTIPVTTATTKRRFSTLKRIKTYLRKSMSQQYLNHCMILHIHCDKTDKLELTEIAQDFIERNDRRKVFLGRFNF